MYWRQATLGPFLLVSMALHTALFFPWPALRQGEQAIDTIPITFLPAPQPDKTPPRPRQEAAPRRAKPTSLVAPKPSFSQEPAAAPAQTGDQRAEEPVKVAPREAEAIARRQLPTLKDLIPPLSWSASGEREAPIRLDTREPKYVTYFESIKRSIEHVWAYPEPALRKGLQGRLVLEFTILGNGSLEGPRLVRSSGVPVLDQEALRAVKAASPFGPIPPWIGKSRIEVSASFEYLDNRLKYGFAP